MKQRKAVEKLVSDLEFQVTYHNHKCETAKAQLNFVNGTVEPMTKNEVLMHIKNHLDNDCMGTFVRAMSELVKNELKTES